MDIKAYVDEEFDEMCDTTPVAEITVAKITGNLSALSASHSRSHVDESTTDVTRADGEVLRAVLRYDGGSDAPTGWAVFERPSTGELEIRDEGVSDDPGQIIRGLRGAICAWFDECDMSDDVILELADKLEGYDISEEFENRGEVMYLVVDHANGYATTINWDRKDKVFACEEISPHDISEEVYEASSVEEIIPRLEAQALK